MPACKPPEIILHKFFQQNESDTEELLDCVLDFLDGDPGDGLSDEQVLGFLNRSLAGKARHGVYETMQSGRTHIIGDDSKILVLPDLVFAHARATQGLRDLNLCEGHIELSLPTPTKKRKKTI